MFNKNNLPTLFFILPAILFFSFFINSSFVLALEPQDITYPILELNNCTDKKACKTFCDNPDNMIVCVNFAEKYNLISKEEIKKAKIITNLKEKTGPGGCKSDHECRDYCENMDHLQECLDFAQENDIMDKKELQEARKVSQVLKTGTKTPGGCTSKKACEKYCDEENHLDECVAFAEKAGLMKPEEVEIIKKTGGKGPGGCRGKKQCDDYCGNSEHMEECMNFAVEHNLMPEQEKKEVQQVLQAIKSGVKPPKCQGRQECDVYCQTPEHSQECLDFAVAAGFIDKQEAQQARKMMEAGLTGGPGGCKGKEECDKFCQQPENMEKCMNFAVKAGMMSKEEYNRAKEFKEHGIQSGPGGCKGKEECESFCQKPENIEECMNFSLKSGFISEDEYKKIKENKNGEFTTGPGGCKNKEECDKYCSEHQEECNQFFNQQNFQPENNRPAMQGPGGCKTKEECEKYCSEHQEECQQVTQSQNLRPDQSKIQEIKGPGGCKNKEECDKYCSEHQTECEQFFNQQTSRPNLNRQEIKDNNQQIRIKQKEQFGPGGCKTKEECDNYCFEHQDECSQLMKENNSSPEKTKEMMKNQQKIDFENNHPFNQQFNKPPFPNEIKMKEGEEFRPNQEIMRPDENQFNQPKEFQPPTNNFNQPVFPDTNIPKPTEPQGMIPNQMQPPAEFNRPPEQNFSNFDPNNLPCDMFAMAPSCDVVPTEAQAACLKCKGQ